ncbi:hypothetical protein [Maridesulfovibrio ferrireducens]|uniref:hypothetical protein n=1 Tax=Maridesulfovibrio ferrireducens TaxID=246191 RepID=UPI001A2133BE|nr:hypothetical protein [Maridesulfovibrio ferrireducens]MBI9110331.1 hypothetical protein [Maridesulfovibrio ferrireducens]
MHPEAPKECSKSIINSHTISKCHFSDITRNGQIYFYNKTNLYQLEQSNGKFQPNLVGMKHASVFYGFCGKHDKELFSPIENSTFKPNIVHCFIAGYRAFSRQLYDKNCSVKLYDNIKKSGFKLNINCIAQQSAALQDVEQLDEDKLIFNKAIKEGNTDDFSFLCIEFKKIPNLMVTGFFTLGSDYKGRKICDTSSIVLKENIFSGKIIPVTQLTNKIPMTSVMYLSSRGKHYAVFCWPKTDDKTFKPILESLQRTKKSRITDALIYTALVHCENVILSPDWWESLSEEKQENLNSLAHPTTHAENIPIKITDLLNGDDPIYDDWEPIAFYSDTIDIKE